MPKLSKLSLERLSTCHPDLQRVVKEAIKRFDFSVACGYRGRQEQDEAYARGHSKLKFPQSKHNSRPSRAVDLVPYPVDWNDVARFEEMAKVVLESADQLGVKLTWGGSWKRFKDRPHFELA